MHSRAERTHPPSLKHFLWEAIWPYRYGFMLMLLAYLAWPIEQVLFPALLAEVVDRLTQYTGDKAAIFGALTVPLSIWLVSIALLECGYRLQGWLMARYMPLVQADLRMQLTEYCHGHSYGFFADHFAGNIAHKIADLPKSGAEIITLLLQLFFPALCIGIATLALLVVVHPMLACVLGLWFVAHSGYCAWFSMRSNVLSARHAEMLARVQGGIVDSITNILNVKLFARLQQEMKRISALQQQETNAHKRALFYMERVKLVLGALSNIAYIPILFYVIYLWQQDELTVGGVVLAITLTNNIMITAWRTGLEFPRLFALVGTCRQALALLRTPHSIVDAPQAVPLSVQGGEIRFEAVSFAYGKGTALFHEKSLVIPAGRKVGLVGYSGSGKSSLVHLLLRFYVPDAGTIRIDGQDIASVTQASLRAAIALIPQDPMLFHRTIAENIGYGRPEATEADIIEAARKADCDSFIRQLPRGYATRVGERGIKLSGGQRQRIAIARAILKNAPILVLDEATAALDSLTEHGIQHQLLQLMHGKTTLVIAHRLSTLLAMDELVVLDKGVVVERGTHAELLQRGQHYAHMWALQSGGFLPERKEEADGQ